MAKRKHSSPAGAVVPRNGYPPGWGPPFATPRDCPAPDWNHLCPYNCASVGTGCVGLKAEYLAKRRQPGETDRAWLQRTLPRYAPLRRDMVRRRQLELDLLELVREHRRKRGFKNTVYMLRRKGKSPEEIAALLDTTKEEVLGARNR